MCIVLGDTNLDYLTWQHPEPSHVRMVDKTKDEIETSGFTQIIRGFTRSWRGQRDFLVDQCWLTRPDRVISWTNESRGRSDHNYIDILFRTKNRNEKTHEVKKRIWKNFHPETFRNRICEIDWENFYECENIDTINDMFENKVRDVLEKIAPMKYIQLRKKHVNWLDDEISQEMRRRDSLRDTAKGTDNDLDWMSYRMARNFCTKLLQNLKKKSGNSLNITV